MEFEESKTQKSGFNHNDEKDYGYSERTISIARPSIKNEILTENDSHKGMMDKQSPSFLKSWQRRYFVLEAKMLKYYKTQNDYDTKK